jgi:hypothetical protein
MADNNAIVLGEFWVDSDGEVFVDITNPLQAMQDLYRFHKIQELQRKLDRQPPLETAPSAPASFSTPLPRRVERKPTR